MVTRTKESCSCHGCGQLHDGQECQGCNAYLLDPPDVETCDATIHLWEAALRLLGQPGAIIII